MTIDPQSFILGLVAGVAAMVIARLIGTFFRPWLRGYFSACPVPLFSVVGMNLRGSPSLMLIDSYITLRKDGVDTSIQEVEYVFMNGRARVTDPDDLVRLVKEHRKNNQVQPAR